MTWAKKRKKNSSKSNRTRALPHLSLLQPSRGKFELARREHKGKEGMVMKTFWRNGIERGKEPKHASDEKKS